MFVSGGSASAIEVPHQEAGSISGATTLCPEVYTSPLWPRNRLLRGPVSASVAPIGDSGFRENGVLVRRKTDSELIIDLHSRSGLTWESLAKALGVSRRSLHMWASGTTVTAAHRAVMERFESLLDSFGKISPADAKLRLLERSAGEPALIDQFRMKRDGGKRVINGPVLSAAEML